jgi:hypothetical protein
MLPIAGRDKRTVKLLATPLHTLAAQTLSLLNTLNNDPSLRRSLDAEARRMTAGWLKRFRESGLEKDCDLKTVRDKVAAHIDAVAVTHPGEIWSKVDFMTFLDWTDLLIVAVAHAATLNIYAWSQLDTPPDIWTVMSVDGTAIHLLMENGEPTTIVAVTSVQSPKTAVVAELAATQRLCRELLPRDWKPRVGWPSHVMNPDGGVAVFSRLSSAS